METKKPFGGISGSTLKLFAIITMLIDHTGATVLRAVLQLPAVANDPALMDLWSSVYSLSRSIGRTAFPVFCFLLVEGFSHTRSVRRYALRLFLFSLISEIPFDIALKGSWYFPSKQNVYFTLLIGLFVLIGISLCERLCERFCHTDPILDKSVLRTLPRSNILTAHPPEASAHPCNEGSRLQQLLIRLLSFVVVALIIRTGMYLATRINTDYNFKGVFLIAALYLSRHSRLFQCMTGAACVSWELPAPLGYIPVYLYNGKRGLRMKYFFYWFYPVHLLLLHVLAEYVISF